MKVICSTNEYSVWLLLNNRSNAYLVQFPNGENILIDCGGKIQRPRLKWELKRNKIIHINYLLLTHTHFDHCANAYYLKKHFNCKIVVQDLEANYLTTGFSILAASHYPFRNRVINLLNSSFKFLVKISKTEADLTFNNELLLTVNNVDIKLLHTPGHSNGSITIILDNALAFAGDNMVHMKPERIYPAFVDDKNLLFTQWEKYIQSGIPLFLPGHGIPVQKSVIEKRIDYYKNKILGKN